MVVAITVFSALQAAESEVYAAEVEPVPRKGVFAFYYAPQLTPEDLSWAKRFKVFVSGAILPPSQIQELKRAGTKLFLYEWITGFYLGKDGENSTNNSWESSVKKGKPEWLLNPQQPDAGPDGQHRAYYYDPFHPELRFAWAKRLAQTLKDSGYDGVFFDLVGSGSVPRDLLKVYDERHLEMPYDQALAGFLRSLRRLRPEALLFTNQGYRVPESYLSVADYKLSESLMTSYAWGESVRIYVEGEGLVEKQESFYRPWEELKRHTETITTDIERVNPKLKIYHLNYVNPLYVPTGRTETIDGREYPVFRKEMDRPAIYYGYAAAKLWGQESYSPAPELMHFGQDDIYFIDLGKPLGEGYEERDGLVMRYYEKGVVALNRSGQRQTADLASRLIPPGTDKLFDCYARKVQQGFTVTLEPTVSPASGRTYPVGRIYLYQTP